MKLCYQAATPDVAIADSVTAYQGPLAKTFGDLGALGYDGVELMTLNPGKLDWGEVKETAEENNLSVVLVCTGEIFGQLGLSYTHPSRSVRREAVERTRDIIDFAGYLGANVNIGRIRGQYCGELDREETSGLAQSAFAELADYAALKGGHCPGDSDHHADQLRQYPGRGSGHGGPGGKTQFSAHDGYFPLESGGKGFV